MNGSPSNEWLFDGQSYIFTQKTRKPFDRFKIDASRGLRQGLAALVTTHEWNGNVCKVDAPGATAEVSFERGERGWNVVTCRVHLGLWGQLVRGKILDDIKHTTIDICGTFSSGNKRIFIVHGHNETDKRELVDFLQSLGLEPVVLNEQDDLGMTIIEKLEYYGPECCFAFVLMTPDDKARSGSGPEPQWRARQNVIMELGWFMARLGRDRVVILNTGGLEIPSDILGIVCIQYEDSIFEAEEQKKITQRLNGACLIE